MKKTFTLLLAAASVAMAATKVDLEWNNNSASLSGAGLTTQKGVTVAYTLNFSNINADYFFYFLDEIGCGAGMGGDEYNGDYIGAWTVHPEYGDTYDYNILDYSADDLLLTSGAAYMSIVYTMYYDSSQALYSVREDLYMWDSVGELLATDFATGAPSSKQLTFGNFKDIYINPTYTTSSGIDVYDGTMESEEDRKAAALAVLRLQSNSDSSSPSGGADSTVPEPTTATLSLLALAALAARRRRK